VGLKSLKSLNLTNGYPNKYKKNNNNKNNNKVKSKPLELFELAGKKILSATVSLFYSHCVQNTVAPAASIVCQ
jgi:hypothetical protein